MRWQRASNRLLLAVMCFALVGSAGCTPWSEYLHNGFKVGPNYLKPAAPVAQTWIDAEDERVRTDSADDAQWWTAFNDPILEQLVQSASRQNLSLREAGFRVLQSRDELGFTVGELFPQSQDSSGGFYSYGVSVNVPNREYLGARWYQQWQYGFNLAWELDLWGRLRRAIEASEANLDASIEQYDDVLVTLLGDVASTYVEYRTYEQRIAYAEENVRIQRELLELATARFKSGQSSELDVNQAQSDLSNTEAMLPQLRIPLRDANNRLCILLGAPPENLKSVLGEGPIPKVANSVAVGLPAQLIARRPDVRRAERKVAAQNAMIGVAQAEFYPTVSAVGTLGWSSENLSDLLDPGSFQGLIGPAFRWKILHYGRLMNNVRRHDDHFQELVAAYQQTLLKANEEVEGGLVRFLESQEEVRALNESVDASKKALEESIAQYKGGLTDFNRVALIQERLVQRQESLAQAQGNVALGLVRVYRAMGGGWQIRLMSQEGIPAVSTETPTEAHVESEVRSE
jgi:NodT family efflux transporter outer membrane factor (OMF) lipoprotein